MKNKALQFLSLVLFIGSFSCSTNKQENDLNGISQLLLGDTLLRDGKIAPKINESCVIPGNFFELSQAEWKSYDKSCFWNQIAFDYEKVSTSKKIRKLFKTKTNRLYIRNVLSPAKTNVKSYYSYLFIEKNQVITDSILIYKEDNFDEALFVDAQIFLIEKNTLITMEVVHDESGTWSERYSKYRIDLKKGKFKRFLHKRFKRKYIEPLPETDPGSDIDPRYHGIFSAYVETESTTTGMASISYTFSITKEFVGLETNTYHEPIRCNGKYRALANDLILELYFTGEEDMCDTEHPMFFIKEENGELFVRGLGGEGTYNDWIKLKKE